ncbi:MAG: hypothetical protein ACHRXM_06740 [Isosphaerales bacterium]
MTQDDLRGLDAQAFANPGGKGMPQLVRRPLREFAPLGCDLERTPHTIGLDRENRTVADLDHVPRKNHLAR